MRIMKLGHKLKAFQNQWIWDYLIWFWLISSKRFLDSFVSISNCFWFFGRNWKDRPRQIPGIQIAKPRIWFHDSIKLLAQPQLWILGHCLSAETQQRTNHLNMGQCHDHRSTRLSSQSLVAEIEIIWITSCSWIQIISCTCRFSGHCFPAYQQAHGIESILTWILSMLR